MSSLQYSVEKKILHFKFPAGTSRGVYTKRKIWLFSVWHSENPGQVGVGECAPLPDLSCDALPDDEYMAHLRCFADQFVSDGSIPYESMRNYPSMLLGFETAKIHLDHGDLHFYDTPFSRNESGITINGLVWMGKYEEMQRRLTEKLNAGFKCVKLKIGAIDFEAELELIKMIRRNFSVHDVELRVDANGGFSFEQAPERLRYLSKYDIHSIEQPIKAHQWKQMAALCQSSPIPIALDEELIGINSFERKRQLLNEIHPQYIVLKPSLHGGFVGSQEWIYLANEQGIGWWVTSALESNIGLNAIAQWLSHLDNRLPIPQGLGTGQLFTDNFPSPLYIEGNKLWFNDCK